MGPRTEGQRAELHGPGPWPLSWKGSSAIRIGSHAIKQVLVFITLVIVMESFCLYRLRAEGFESGDGIAHRDPRTGWRLEPSQLYAVNAEGLRGGEIPPPRSAGQLRVLCVGGSVTFGAGVPDGETWPDYLQTCVRASTPDAVVVNAGVPGFSSHQDLDMLIDQTPRQHPRIIVVMVGINEMAAQYFREVQPNTARGIFERNYYGDAARGVLYRSAVYRYLTCRLVPPPPHEEAGQLPRGPLYASCDNLRLIHAFARAQGVRLLICDEAWRQKTRLRVLAEIEERNRRTGQATTYVPNQWFVDFVTQGRIAHENLAAELNVPYLDMSAAIQATGIDEDRLFRPSDCIHYTPFGNRTAAGIVFDKLVQLGWVREGRP